MKLATAILWQINVPVLYEYLAVIAGKKPFDLGFLDRAVAILRTGVLLNVLFYSALWLVKLSFLMFFRRLGSKVKGQKIWWWCILVFTVLTWAACIADFQYKCSLSSLAFIVCEFPPRALGLSNPQAQNCTLANERAGGKHIAGLPTQYVTSITHFMLTVWRMWLLTASVSLGRLYLAGGCTL